jgi:AcrR family transcriptional regulator
MRYSSEQKAASRDALVRAAARVFREKGYAGVGVDQLSEAAGLTSGSFYKHFTGKPQALLEVVKAGVNRVANRVRKVRSGSAPGTPGGWINDFATLHTSPEHVASIGLGCNLPTLSVEVARAPAEVKTAFEQSLVEAVEAMAEDAPFAGEPDGEARAIAMLAVLTGGAVLARASATPGLQRTIAEAVRKAANLVAATRLPDLPRTSIQWRPSDY